MNLLSVMINGLALFLFWLFIYAAVGKLRPANMSYYQNIIAQYGIGLPELAGTITVLLGIVEAAIGIAVLIPASRMIASVAGAVLLAIYLIAMWRQLAQGKADMDCGCSGPAGSAKISAALLWRNAIYIAALTACGFNHTEPVQSWALWMLSLLLGVVLVTTSLSAEQLIANGQRLKRLQKAMA